MRCNKLTLAVLAIVGLAAFGLAHADDPVRPQPAAVERTRETVKMLDDLYKNAVVSITKTYVEKQADTPAAAVAKEVFEAMHQKGWHHARLVDASGKPKSQRNVAKSEFEKRSVAAMKSGKTYYEEVGEKDGKPVLRAATIVPAVMPQCVVCHGGKEGGLLGAIVYEVPIK
ncbi:MAG: DUF3365 domain-containing protein [Gemmataceae bacterium]|nr:DUF3365 domain-containing protein [Gemmataceae bacterium]